MGITSIDQERALHDFRVAFSEIMGDAKKKIELKSALQSEGINEATLYRWTNGTRPRSANILALMKHCAPEDRAKLAPSVEVLVAPNVNISSSLLSPLVTVIPSAFYERILTALDESPLSRKFMTIEYLVLYQALHQLDPSHSGLEIIISELISTDENVHCLRERVSLSTEQTNTLELRWALLGAEQQLEGSCVTDLTISPKGYAMAVPLLRGGRISGCLSVKSQVEYDFSHDVQRLIMNYASLAALGFEDHQFYDPASIKLLVLPPAAQQKAVMDTLHQRKIAAMTGNKSIGNKQAEMSALQQIIAELSQS